VTDLERLAIVRANEQMEAFDISREFRAYTKHRKPKAKSKPSTHCTAAYQRAYRARKRLERERQTQGPGWEYA